MLIETENFKIIATNKKVEAYSIKPIPFDGLKDWQKEFKKGLSECIKKLDADTNEGLDAAYGSIDGKAPHADTENLLLYNIGSGAFKNTCRHFIKFSTLSPSETKQHIKDNDENKFGHYYRYHIISIPGRVSHVSPLVRWDGLPIFSIRGVHKPLDYWRWMHEHSESAHVMNAYFPGHQTGYGIEIHIDTPETSQMNAYTSAKAMLDGIICAFHCMPDGKDSHELETIAKQLNVQVSYLTDKSIAVLGERNFVSRSSRITWNPNDDLCEQALIRINYHRPQWRMSGTLYTL